MKNKKKISIWSDFACPYCYIGEKRLMNAINELGVEDEIEIEFRAFELDPNASLKPSGTAAERLAAKYGMSLEAANKKIDEINALGKDLGINFHYEKAKYTNTFDAHRLMKFAEDQYEAPVYMALANAIFHAYFVEGKSLSDRRELLKLAESVAMDATQANEVLERGYYAEQVRFDEREAADRGVHGVPYMVFDGEFAVPGAISTEDCKMVVREMLAKEKPGKLNTSSCDETGCKVS